MIQVYEQKIKGLVRERMTVDHISGMATLEKFDHDFRLIGRETFSAGDSRVSQFIHRAEPSVTRTAPPPAGTNL